VRVLKECILASNKPEEQVEDEVFADETSVCNRPPQTEYPGRPGPDEESHVEDPEDHELGDTSV